jgi:hypothetical protein
MILYYLRKKYNVNIFYYRVNIFFIVVTHLQLKSLVLINLQLKNLCLMFFLQTITFEVANEKSY